MTATPEPIDLLLSYEKNDASRAYGAPVERIASRQRDIYIISDLHLASGKGIGGTFNGLENFFYDASFKRFLRHAEKTRYGKGALLVINGDFIDFLRIADVPVEEHEFEEWRGALERTGISKTNEELRRAVSPKERAYGFKTQEYKALWRLLIAMKGHPEFMSALVEWLLSGNEIVIVKGNHDLEWYWPGVRNYFRMALADRVRDLKKINIIECLRDIVLPRVLFADNAVEVDSTLYIEHGHRYDRYSHVAGPALLKNRKELNLPFGSFFNRYLINRIELIYPFIDNVRPRENLLPLLFKEHFFLGCRVLFQHVPFTLKMVPKSYFRYMFARLLPYMAPIIFLIVAAIVSSVLFLKNGPGAGHGAIDFFSTTIGGLIANPLKIVAWTIASYFFTRVVAYFQLVEPDTLAENAGDLFDKSNGYRYIVFGHTHNPDQKIWGERRFWNSGTWIPMIEFSNAQVRIDKTFTFVHFAPGPSGALVPDELQHWNDDAGRAEPMAIVEGKP
jgi:UDP-2,3-diacylglucosamine pyrophosphatase LpxH